MGEIAVFCCWILLFLLFCGVGYYFFSLLRITPQGAQGWINTFWVGWIFALFLLQVISFFMPVDIKSFFIIAGISLLGILRTRSIFFLFFLNHYRKLIALFFLLFFLVLSVANSSLFPPLHYDSGLYHLQAVKWAADYPVIPGLGNLHMRLASNSAYFLYIALLDAVTGKGSHLGQGLLYFVLISQAILAVYKIFFYRNKPVFSLFFTFLTLYAIIMAAHNIFISSPAPDFPIYILGIVSAQQLVFLSEKLSARIKTVEEEVFCLTMVSVAGIIIKLSYLVMGLSTMIIVTILLKTMLPPETRKKLLPWVCLCVAAGLLPWIARNIILSGYPFYPLPFLPFPVEWRIPLASIKAYIHSIAVCAQTRIDIDTPSWVEYLAVPGIMIVAGTIGFLWYRFIYRKKMPVSKLSCVFLLPAAASVIFWAFTAPNLRFAGSAFFVLGLGSTAIVLYGILNHKPAAGFKLFTAAYLIFCLFRIYQMPFVPHNNNFLGFYDNLPIAVNMTVTERGDIFYMPVETDQCFAAPLPCTPYLNKSLSYRCHNNLACGFILRDRKEDDVQAGIIGG